MNLDKIHQLFMAGDKLSVIAHKLEVTEGYIQKLISKQRQLYPEQWPVRTKSKIVQPVHVYECEECVVTFAVEQAFEEQDLVKCPICSHEDSIRDVAAGEIIIRR
jgi:putative FmdB family regulatory protein